MAFAIPALNDGLESTGWFSITRARGSSNTGEKFVDRKYIGSWARWPALALARADALQGNSAKAKTEYQDFLNLWTEVDPDIPILKEAKAECAKLRKANQATVVA